MDGWRNGRAMSSSLDEVEGADDVNWSMDCVPSSAPVRPGPLAVAWPGSVCVARWGAELSRGNACRLDRESRGHPSLPGVDEWVRRCLP